MTDKKDTFIPGPRLVKRIRKHMENLDMKHVLYHETPISREKAIELKREASALEYTFEELIKQIRKHEAPKTGWTPFQFEHYDNGERTGMESRFDPILIKESWTPGLENMNIIKYSDNDFYEMELCINSSGLGVFHVDFAYTSKNPDELKQFMMLAATKCKTPRDWYKLAEQEAEK